MTDHRERAQLLLIGSVVVAVAILGTVVLLNIIHVPPDVSAQTDSQSVTDAERVQDTIEDDLEQLVLMHTSVNDTGQPLPYVNSTYFGEAVEVYGQNYTELASTSSATVTSVEYVNDSSTGVVANKGGSSTFPNANIIAGNIEDVPFILLNITKFPSSGTDRLEFRKVGPDKSSIVFSSDRIWFDDSNGNRSVFDVDATDEFVEVRLTNGEGKIRSNDDVNSSVGLELSNVNNIKFDTSDSEGKYVVSATNTKTCPASGQECYGENTTVDVNPTFHVVYQDANVAFETTFSVFGGDS